MLINRIALTLLAAGRSARMETQKGLLELNGRSVLHHIVQQLRSIKASQRIYVLSSALNTHLTTEATERKIINREPEKGQLYSLQLSLRKLQEEKKVEGTFLYLLDSPLELPEKTACLIEYVQRDPDLVYIASYEDQPGHPVWIPSALFPAILEWDGPQGLRGFFETLQNNKIKQIETGLPSALHDMDTPREYEQLLQYLKEKRP